MNSLNKTGIEGELYLFYFLSTLDIINHLVMVSSGNAGSSISTLKGKRFWLQC